MRWVDLLVITDTPTRRALLLETPHGYALPQPETRDEHFWQVVSPVNRAAAALGLAATTLRCFRQVHDATADELRRSDAGLRDDEITALRALRSRLLAPMHHALIYHRTILPAMEHGWEMERMLPYYLRFLL